MADSHYYAVIFTSKLPVPTPEGYGTIADQMVELAATQQGFLGIESTRDTEGNGITVSYWKTLADVARWKAVPEHLAAQKSGKEQWYECFKVRVARVEREYGSSG
jgi:heme-degrading monooxygenase HmoA